MDDRTDLALYRIEKEIRRNRAPIPCDDYEPSSRLLTQCLHCGWDEERHRGGE